MQKITTALLVIVMILSIAPTAAAKEEPGRWVDFGKWNGVVDCESSPSSSPALVTPTGKNLAPRGTAKYRREVRVDQSGYSSDRGAFQFLPSTWDSVARKRGALHLVGKDPRTTTLATQLRQAEWLRRNVGMSQWSCGYRYGDGTLPQYVTGEIKTPNKPVQCKHNIANKYDRTWRVARSVCNTKNYQALDLKGNGTRR